MTARNIFSPNLPPAACGLLLATLALPSVLAQSTAITTAGDDIIITPMVHSSVQLEYGELVIQIDPWSVRGLSDFKPADLILVTDTPSHHLDPAAIAALSRPHTTTIVTPNGAGQIPQALVMANGELLRVAGVTIAAIPAYDILPGAPEHPKGDANGYVVTVGGKRLFFAGVSECVSEIKALRDIDVAFLPLNIPPGRMRPRDAADCARQIAAPVVFVYHYDQGYARRAADPDAADPQLPDGISVAESLDLFAQALQGSDIHFQRGNWYPPLP